MAKLVQERKSQRTLMHRLHPLRSTSRLMAANYPDMFHDFCDALCLPKNQGFDTQYRETEGNPVLLIPEVMEFLDWLKGHPKRIILIPGVALQALCALQMQEALRLTWDKIDLDRASIVIDGVVKNQWQIRKIPIPDKAVEILRDHRYSYEESENALFPFYRNDYRDYSRLLHAALHDWRPGIDIAPKDLRNTYHGIVSAGLEYVFNRTVCRACSPHDCGASLFWQQGRPAIRFAPDRDRYTGQQGDQDCTKIVR